MLPIFILGVSINYGRGGLTICSKFTWHILAILIIEWIELIFLFKQSRSMKRVPVRELSWIPINPDVILVQKGYAGNCGVDGPPFQEEMNALQLFVLPFTEDRGLIACYINRFFYSG